MKLKQTGKIYSLPEYIQESKKQRDFLFESLRGGGYMVKGDKFANYHITREKIFVGEICFKQIRTYKCRELEKFISSLDFPELTLQTKPQTPSP